jgi:glycosyltransferase involved in cell wall biosynthesis
VGGVEVRRYWLPRTPQNLVGFLAEYFIAHVQLAWRTVQLLGRGIDVLHVCNPPDTIAMLLRLARLYGRRTVFDNHDLFPELFELRYGRSVIASAVRHFQRVAFRSADLVLTTNDSQREIVLRSVIRAPRSVVVVRNGPVQGAFATDAHSRRPGNGDVLNVLFLGALEPQDGVVVLAEVMHRLVHKHKLSVRLTVVGDGSCRKELAEKCERFGVSDRVIFTGRVPHDKVASHLAQADICVDPAPCNELNHASTMIKVAEYMAAGKPIVAFDLRETRRTAGDGALYAPCGDADVFADLVAEIGRQPEVAKRLIEQAKKRLPELFWERSAENLLDAYAQIAGTPML